MVVDGNKKNMKKDDFKDVEGLEISLLYKCNVKCEFCHLWNLKEEHEQRLSKEKVFSILSKWIKEWKKSVVFTWGEPTLENNLPLYIEYSKKLWFDFIRVHSNGFAFQDIEYVKDLHKKWLTWVTISVHWYKIIHDSITKTNWSFNVIFKSFINFEKIILIDKEFSVDTNTIICKKNYLYLKQLLLFLMKFSIKRRMFTYTFDTVLYHDFNKLKNVIVSYKDLIEPLDDLLKFCYKTNIKDFVLDSVPFCLVNKKYWKFIEENYFPKKFFYLLDYYKAHENTYNDWKIKYIECKKCIKDDVCTWFSEDNNLLYWKTNFKILR